MKEFNYLVMPRGQLASSMTSTQTTLTLGVGQGAQWPTGICTATISLGNLTTDPTITQLLGGETVEVESRTNDVLTLRRRDINSSASTLVHSSGDLVQMLLTPADMENIHARMTGIEDLLARTISNVATGIKVTSPDYEELKVVQLTAMTVKIKAGACLVSRRVGFLNEDFTTPTIVAPSISPRIDLVSLDTDTDTVVVTAGSEAVSPSAPATPSGHCALATIALTTSHTAIITANITDVRVEI